MQVRRGAPLLAGLGVAALAGAALTTVGAAPGQPTVRWAKSWEAAVAEATARDVPIFVTFHKDG